MHKLIKPALYALPLGFLAAFFFYPLASILSLSFSAEGGLGALAELPDYAGTFAFTLGQAVISTALTVVLALPGAYVFAHYDFPGKRLLSALSTIPFVLPTVVVAAAFSALLGPRGWINEVLMGAFGLESAPVQLRHTLAMVLIAHVFYNYTVVLRMVSGFWANLNPRLEEAARVLGGNRWRVWRRVTLPLLLPAIAASAALVFLFTFTSFGVVLILGGPRYATLEVEIYRQALNLFNLPAAATLALAQIAFMFAVMGAYTYLQRRTSRPLQLQSARARQPRSIRARLFVGVSVIFIGVLLVAPLGALALRSVKAGRDEAISLRYYGALSETHRGSVLFVPPVEAIKNSLIFALITTVLAVALGLIAAYMIDGASGWVGALLDPIMMLPLATSAVTLGFGFIIALDEPPLNLRASPVMVPFAHTLVALPFVIRSILPALRAIPENAREAARVLGASPVRVFARVDLPLIWRGLIVGAVFAFTVSMGEFGASTFIARPETPTMPVVIHRLLGQPGAINYGQALAMSTILMGVCVIGFLAIERFRVDGGEF